MRRTFEKNLVTINIPIVLSKIAGAGDVVTTYPLSFNGYVEKVDFVTTDPVTTGAKAATLNLEINTTNVTGGTVALTSAACDTLGKVVAGAAVTGNHGFKAGDTLSVEAASVTAFVEGQGVLVIVVAQEQARN